MVEKNSEQVVGDGEANELNGLTFWQFLPTPNKSKLKSMKIPALSRMKILLETNATKLNDYKRSGKRERSRIYITEW